MKRFHPNGPGLAVALLCLIGLVGALYTHPNAGVFLGRWSPATHWNTSLHLVWDGPAAAFLTAALLCVLGTAWFGTLSGGGLVSALAFALTAIAGSTELLLLGGCGLLAPLLPQRRAGVWIATALVSLYLVALNVHTLFGTSDLRECLRLSGEPYDFPAAAANRAIIFLGIGTMALAVGLGLLRGPTQAVIRFRTLGVLAVAVWVARLSFLSTVTGHYFPFGARVAFPLALVAVAGLFGWAFFRARSETAASAASPPSKHLRRWNAGVERAILWLEDGLWPGIWRIPVQAGRTLGLFFDYWQGGTPQYTLLVLLLGTLILFWAALKTQVIW